MNALTKKVILSIFTWILIFITLGTSTFAWFSMNYIVTASNVKIRVTSDATYLFIGDNEGIKDNKIDLSKETTPAFISGGFSNRRVYPTFYGDGTKLGNITTEVGKWYTAYNRDYNRSNNTIVSANEISYDKLSNHLLIYEAYLTLSNESQPYNDKLAINFHKLSGDDSVSVVVELWTDADVNNPEKFHLNVNETYAITDGNVSITSDTAYKITFYVYIDGNSTNVNSNYLGLHDVSGEITISFNIM